MLTSGSIKPDVGTFNIATIAQEPHGSLPHCNLHCYSLRMGKTVHVATFHPELAPWVVDAVHSPFAATTGKPIIFRWISPNEQWPLRAPLPPPPRPQDALPTANQSARPADRPTTGHSKLREACYSPGTAHLDRWPEPSVGPVVIEHCLPYRTALDTHPATAGVRPSLEGRRPPQRKAEQGSPSITAASRQDNHRPACRPDYLRRPTRPGGPPTKAQLDVIVFAKKTPDEGMCPLSLKE